MSELEDITVVGLGQACFDFLGQIPCFPEEDSKTEMTGLKMQCGGPVASALAVLSGFGISTSFIGSISDDYFGIEIQKRLEEASIDTRFLKVTPGFTSQCAFISINSENGNRNIFWKRGTAPFLNSGNIDLGVFPGAEYLHLDGLMIDASIEGARQARKSGIKVIIDAGTLRAGFPDLIKYADVLITSENFSKTFLGSDRYTPEKALKKLKKASGAETIIVTRGAGGSTGLYDENIHVQPAFEVKTVDTTGAGDVYHGAYIYGMIMKWSVPECMRFASAVSALKCRHIGVKNSIPAVNEINKFIDSRKF